MENMGIEELKKQYGMEKDADIRERILMIIWLKSGKSTYEIGDLLFCPHSKVVYWKKRFESGGIDGLKTLGRSGRPGSIDSNGTELEDLPVRSGGDNPGLAAFLRPYLPDNAVINKDGFIHAYCSHSSFERTQYLCGFFLN